MNRCRLAIALGLVLSALALGACSGEPEPKFAPSESSLPVPSESPSATQRASSPRDEQAVFLQDYFSEVSASISTGDSSSFLALSSRDCESCAVIAKNLASAYNNGGSITGGKWTVSSPRYSGRSPWGPVWDLDVVTKRERWHDRDGTVVKIVRPSVQHLAVALERARGRWRVREMRLR